MIIQIDKDNKLVDMNNCDNYTDFYFKDKHLMIKGEIDGIIKEDLTLKKYDKEILLMNIIKSKNKNELGNVLSKIFGSYSIVVFENGFLKWISTDLSAIQRLYIYEYNNNKYIFDDFHSFYVQHKDKLNFYIDKKRSEYFINKGYNLPGETYINNLRNSIPGIIHFFNKEYDEVDIMKHLSFDFVANYDKFKKTLINVISKTCKDKKNYLLLSGGVDSNLLLAIMDKLGIRPNLVTAEYQKPYDFNINKRDVKRSLKINEELFGSKFNHKIININLLKLKKVLKLYTKEMPFESHLSIVFYEILKKISQEDTNEEQKICVISGQNADSLYNLGPTENITFNIFSKSFKGGIKNLICRYLISDQYASLFDKPVLKKIIDSILSIILFLGDKEKYIFPQNRKEIINYFLYSSSYLALKKENQKINQFNSIDKKISYKNFKEELFRNKLRSFVDGRDSKVIYKSGELFDKRVFLPFSSQPMIYYFYKLKWESKDIFEPKRYIYKFAEELGIDRNVFNIDLPNDSPSYKEFEEEILNSIFNGEFTNLQRKLGSFWIKNYYNFK